MNVIKDKLSNSPKSKKEQIVKCETIFDHNPTEEEIRRLIARIPKEKYLTIDPDTKYYDLYCLYLMRDDKETAEKYYLMISEEARKRAEETAKNRVICGGNIGKGRSQFTDEERAQIEEAKKLALL
jgi:hypothetical protein